MITLKRARGDSLLEINANFFSGVNKLINFKNKQDNKN